MKPTKVRQRILKMSPKSCFNTVKILQGFCLLLFINLSKQDGFIRIMGPSHPISVGSNVTLSCHSQDAETMAFVKDGMVSTLSTDNHQTISFPSVKKSDAGRYRCDAQVSMRHDKKFYTLNVKANINECASDPCKNGATCVDGVDRYTCSCVDGFTGTHCDTNINECASDPCKNGATCVDGVDRYTCSCVDGFTGTHCDSGTYVYPIIAVIAGTVLLLLVSTAIYCCRRKHLDKSSLKEDENSPANMPGVILLDQREMLPANQAEPMYENGPANHRPHAGHVVHAGDKSTNMPELMYCQLDFDSDNITSGRLLKERRVHVPRAAEEYTEYAEITGTRVGGK